MKKLILSFTFVLLCICTMTSKAEQLITADQYPLLAEIAAGTKERSNLPLDHGQGVIWQDIYADKNKLVFVYIIQLNSDQINSVILEDAVKDMANHIICNNDKRALEAFQDIDATIVGLYKFNDKAVSIEKPAKGCPYT